MGSVLSCLNYTLVVGLVSLVLFSFFLLQIPKAKQGSRKPPLVAGSWPIIGHLWQLSRSQMPHLTLSTMADKYGPIFTIKLGSQRAVVINNWKIARECFTTNDLSVSSRPRLIATQKLTYDQAMFAFSPHSPYWREMRKIATLELLSNRRIELLSHVRVSEVETSIKELFKLWAERKDPLGRAQVDLGKMFGKLTLNAILRMVVGKRCSGGGVTCGEEVSKRCLKAMRDFFRLLGLFVVGDAVPCLRWLDFGGHERDMEETAKELDVILGEWLEEHREKRGSGVAVGDQDFMDVMLSVLEGTDFAGYDADTIHKATALVLHFTQIFFFFNVLLLLLVIFM